jgi:hypothetical protein
MRIYEQIINDAGLGWMTFAPFWGALMVIGYCALVIKDNRGKVGLSMLFALITAVAILCMTLKMWLSVS